jgi:hypothetical protein
LTVSPRLDEDTWSFEPDYKPVKTGSRASEKCS